MRFLLILSLVWAVQCDDDSNSYYVIEVPESLDGRLKTFKVHWNVPTMQCRSKKIPFDDLYERFGIIQNEGDAFVGETVTILYDPGKFPALFERDGTGDYVERNGGVPQEGNLEKHLDEFKRVVASRIPDPEFNGVAIIDFESWRPVFRQNFGVLSVYKDVSYKKEYERHWWWPDTWIEAEAKYRFEASAREFMQETISIAKQMRPKARWGYYAYPYCFNMAAGNMAEDCAHNVREENNQVFWLWAESTGLYPSLYSSRSLSTSKLVSMIKGRIREASRVKLKGTSILPYFWYRYRDGGFLTEGDLSKALETIYNSEASGIIIWGSSSDVKTKEKCKLLKDYIYGTFGPNVAKYTKHKQKTQSDEEMTLKPALEDFYSPNTQIPPNVTDLNFHSDNENLNGKYTLNNESSESETVTSTTDKTTELNGLNYKTLTEFTNAKEYQSDSSNEMTTESFTDVTQMENDILSDSDEKIIANDELMLLFTNLTSQILDFTTDSVSIDSNEASTNIYEGTTSATDHNNPTESVDEVVTYIYKS